MDYALEPVSSEHLDDVHAIYSDPETWRHLPTARFTSIDDTASMVRSFEQEWAEVGLSHWVVRAGQAGEGVAVGDVVGVVGVSTRDRLWWNLGYRLTPSVWGHGLARRIGREAVTQAHTVRPDWPVVSRLLSSNPASERVSRGIGLRTVWSGPARGVDGVDRLILADRDVDPYVMQMIVDLG
jgi:RimJ/RimL family protein N-acetyltransferase